MFESDQKNLGLSRALDGEAKMEGLQGAKAYKKLLTLGTHFYDNLCHAWSIQSMQQPESTVAGSSLDWVMKQKGL